MRNLAALMTALATTALPIAPALAQVAPHGSPDPNLVGGALLILLGCGLLLWLAVLITFIPHRIARARRLDAADTIWWLCIASLLVPFLWLIILLWSLAARNGTEAAAAAELQRRQLDLMAAMVANGRLPTATMDVGQFGRREPRF